MTDNLLRLPLNKSLSWAILAGLMIVLALNWGGPWATQGDVVDLTPPFTTAHAPAPGATGVALNANIVMEI